MIASRCLRAVLAALLIALAGCGTGVNLRPGQDNAGLHPGGATMSQLLSELDQLPTPSGASDAQFGQLKGALRAMLVNSGATKFSAAAPAGVGNVVSDLTLDLSIDASQAPHDAISWTYRNTGDYDQNSQVNISDLTALGANLGKTPASPDWHTKARFADGDNNGEVNISDITPIGANLLSQVQSYRVEGADDTAGPWTEISTMSFADAMLQEGAKSFQVIVESTPFAFYRVTPLDATSSEGVPSLPSSSFVLAPTAEFVGYTGGPQIVSFDGTTLVLQLPAPLPTTIAVGDAIIGEDPTLGAFLLSALTVDQAGDQVTITGQPAPLTDFASKGLFEASNEDATELGHTRPVTLPASKKASAAQYTLSRSNQVLHTGGGMEVQVNQLDLSYIPEVSLTATVNQDLAPKLRNFSGASSLNNFDMVLDAQADPATFSGIFNTDVINSPDPAYETLLEDKKITVPIVMTFSALPPPLTYQVLDTIVHMKVYLGVTGNGGSGAFDGGARFDAHAHYFALRNFAQYSTTATPPGWYGESSALTPVFSTVSPPAAHGTTGGGTSGVAFYLRVEFDGTLLGNKSNMQFVHGLGLNLTETATPSAGYDYVRNALTIARRDIDFTALGDPSLALQQTDLEDFAQVDSGFIAAATPPQSISGTVLEDTTSDGVGDTPLAGVTLDLYDNTAADVFLATTTSAADGTFTFDYNAIAGAPTPPVNLKIEASKTSYIFAPQNIAWNYAGGVIGGRDFVAVFSDTDKSISGTITNGLSQPLAGVSLEFQRMGSPVWFDTTAADGTYNTGAHFTTGIDIKVIPTMAGETFSPTDITVTMDADKTGVDFTAFP